MRAATFVIRLALVTSVSACDSDTSQSRPDGTARTVLVSPGALSAHERATALTVAKRTQRTVIGSFVGATAFTSTESPPGDTCTLNIRLVWAADANFSHAGIGPPDGPRKALLLSVRVKTGKVCETSALYNHVGANRGETLLYGQWPRLADG